MREGKTRYVILGLLAEAPMTGYNIKKLVDARFRFFWSESYGQLYPELKALRKEGLVVLSKRSGREENLHAITPAGRDALRGWLSRPTERESVRFEILLKMYFSGLGEPGGMVPQLQEFGRHYASELEVLRRYRTELERIPDEDGHHRDILRVIDFGQRTYEAYLEWCRKSLEELEGR